MNVFEFSGFTNLKLVAYPCDKINVENEYKKLLNYTDFASLHFIQEYVNKEIVFIDFGAELGIKSCIAANQTHQILAFENRLEYINIVICNLLQNLNLDHKYLISCQNIENWFKILSENVIQQKCILSISKSIPVTELLSNQDFEFWCKNQKKVSIIFDIDLSLYRDQDGWVKIGKMIDSLTKCGFKHFTDFNTDKSFTNTSLLLHFYSFTGNVLNIVCEM